MKHLSGLLADILNRPTTPVITVHILHHGFPICRFSERTPGNWPPRNRWVDIPEYRRRKASGDLSQSCTEEELEPSAAPGAEFCEDCEVALTAQRTCEYCGAVLLSEWPSMYCNSKCELSDTSENYGAPHVREAARGFWQAARKFVKALAVWVVRKL